MQTITIPKKEYQMLTRDALLYNSVLRRLPQYKKSSKAVQEYLSHVLDIADARKAVAIGKTISQEKLFKSLEL